MEIGICPYCLLEVDCDCAFEKAVALIEAEEASKSPERKALEAQEYEDSVIGPVQKTHCWQCQNHEFIRQVDKRDGVYGNFCPTCYYSLRYHPFYGLGRKGDLANKRS